MTKSNKDKRLGHWSEDDRVDGGGSFIGALMLVVVSIFIWFLVNG